ncbi:MAG: ABC transporter substrate-binding protein [Alphaproteobacteria bacterium]|nr:ABC transporter substrate-binding protein [Alphaproteobacteria bacterium]
MIAGISEIRSTMPRAMRTAMSSGPSRSVLWLGLAAGLFACASALAPIDAARAQSTTLTWSHPQEPPNWNYWGTGASALAVPTFHNVLEPLVELLGDGSVAPLLAESWEISADGLVYVFKLRAAKFHDGSNFGAGDVVYSILKNKDSPLAPTRTPLAPMKSVEKVDDRTVKITLTAPSQRLLKELGQGAGIIVPEGSHEKLDLRKQMIGTGPYVFGEYRPDVSLTLTRFAGYWGEKPAFERIVHRFIPDETAAINALLAGEIDMVASVFGEGLDRLKVFANNPRFKVLIPAPMEINYMFLSTKNAVLRDIRVRQAIAHAINRPDYLDGAQASYGKTTCQWVIPSSEPWNSGYCPYPHDPRKARALLAAAGHSRLELDFPFVTVAEHPVIKDIAVEQLAAVGITLKPRALDLATYLEQVFTNGSYEISNLTSGVKAESYVCKGGRQPLGRPDSVVCDEKFDALVTKSDRILDAQEYKKTMAEMTAALADSAWVIPIHQKSTPTLTRAELVGHKDYRFRVEMDARKLRWAR